MKNKEIDKYIGNRLKLKRKESGMSQESLAFNLDISPQQVQKYESGKNRISAGRLYEMSNLLKVSPHFFFEGLHEVRSFDLEISERNKTIKAIDKIARIKNEKIKNGIFDIILGLEE